MPWALAIIDGPVPWVVRSIAAAALLALFIRYLVVARDKLKAVALTIAVGVGGMWIGMDLTWFVVDVLNPFGAGPGKQGTLWIEVSFGAIAVAVLFVVRGRLWNRSLAAVAVVAILLTGSLGVDAGLGVFPSLGSVFGVSTIPPLTVQTAAPGPSSTTDATPATWIAPAGLATQGVVGSVEIPAPVSGFPARPAIIYLPPAALVADPPVLPVLIMLSGQPGEPEDVFTAGHLASFLDGYAAAHHGLAPIVVAPDQLGSRLANPMCVDSPLGNSASYLTVDVPNWIRAHYRVAASPSGWGIGGFSQGGTCSAQLGFGHPELFSAIYDVAGEKAPVQGPVESTIASAFGGDPAAYAAAAPAALLTAHGPYRDFVASLVYGAGDDGYGPDLVALAAEATAQGVTAQSYSIPGRAHDWYAVQDGYGPGLTPIFAHFGLAVTS